MTCPNEGSCFCREFDCNECTDDLMTERIAILESIRVDEAWQRRKDDEACKLKPGVILVSPIILGAKT